MSLGGDTNKVNRQRENKGINIANDVLARADANAAALRAQTEKAARDSIKRERQYAAEYTTSATGYGNDYLSRLESALSDFTNAVSPIYSGMQQDISSYKDRSEGIATRSAQEATDYMLGNQQNFIDFASALTEAATSARQNLISQYNPYQLAQQTQASKNNLDMLSGRMPADVMGATTRNSAYAALQGGYGATSQMGQAAQARNLGLTSLDLMGYADQSAQNWAKTIYDTQINGLQTTPAQVADLLGLRASDVLQVNQANNMGLLAAQQDLGKLKVSGLNTALGYRGNAYQNIYTGSMESARNVYSGGTETSNNAANLLGAGYRTASTLMGAAVSDYGNQRQSINSTAWQNQLQSISDRNAQTGALVTGAATIVGALAGGAGGAMIGASVGQAASGGLGLTGGRVATPTAYSSSAGGSLWDSALGLMGTPRNNGGFGSLAGLSTATGGSYTPTGLGTASNGYGGTASYFPSLGGWVPKAQAVGYRTT